MSLASTHGITVPATLPAAMQKHIDELKKMTGNSFDKHYVSMMVSDHQKDLSKFKKASTGSSSDDLKTWTTNAVPVLQKHLDSIQAIKKGTR
jgi:putative membrane protein